MIAPGGQTAYLGPTAGVIQYFENLGFEVRKYILSKKLFLNIF